jgi:hypothetical protein
VAEDPELADMMQPLDIASIEEELTTQIAAASTSRRARQSSSKTDGGELADIHRPL